MLIGKAILLFILSGALVVCIVFTIKNREFLFPSQNINTNNSPKSYSRSHKSQPNTLVHKSDSKSASNTSNVSNYISPYDFKIGNLQKPQPLSNMCEPNGVMYPLNDLEPTYTPFKTCKSCTQFLEAP